MASKTRRLLHKFSYTPTTSTSETHKATLVALQPFRPPWKWSPLRNKSPTPQLRFLRSKSDERCRCGRQAGPRNVAASIFRRPCFLSQKKRHVSYECTRVKRAYVHGPWLLPSGGNGTMTTNTSTISTKNTSGTSTFNWLYRAVSSYMWIHLRIMESTHSITKIESLGFSLRL